MVKPGDDGWKVLASVCVATLFEILSNEGRSIVITQERVDDLRMVMAHGLAGINLSANTKGEITVSAYVRVDDVGECDTMERNQ